MDQLWQSTMLSSLNHPVYVAQMNFKFYHLLKIYSFVHVMAGFCQVILQKSVYGFPHITELKHSNNNHVLDA
jgi:hypothetical protein